MSYQCWNDVVCLQGLTNYINSQYFLSEKLLIWRSYIICYHYIRKNKNQHQRVDINSIDKKIIKIPDYHDVSKEFLNIRIENLLKNGRIRNKPNRGNPSFSLSDVAIEIRIHDDDDSYSVSHADTASTEYNLQTPNNSPIAFTIPETQELIWLMTFHLPKPYDQRKNYKFTQFQNILFSI